MENGCAQLTIHMEHHYLTNRKYIKRIGIALKILIFGIVASGKTTLARELSLRYNIKYYEGDCIAWGFAGEQRYKRTETEQRNIILDIDKKGDWIIEGTYRESQKCLFDMDTSLNIRKLRIITRFIKQIIGIEKCNYKPTFEMLRLMLKWTDDFEKNRKKYEDMLLLHKHKLVWVKSKKELQEK